MKIKYFILTISSDFHILVSTQRSKKDQQPHPLSGDLQVKLLSI